MRLFVAVDLPDDVKNALESLRSDVPGATWVKRQALHLTLQFLGDPIPSERLSEITSALETVRVPPFDMQLKGVGRFPSNVRQSARVLWAGVAPNPTLTGLHWQVTQAMSSIGFSAEDRQFSPHITLARFKAPKPSHEVDSFLSRHADFETDLF